MSSGTCPVTSPLNQSEEWCKKSSYALGSSSLSLPLKMLCWETHHRVQLSWTPSLIPTINIAFFSPQPGVSRLALLCVGEGVLWLGNSYTIQAQESIIIIKCISGVCKIPTISSITGSHHRNYNSPMGFCYLLDWEICCLTQREKWYQMTSSYSLRECKLIFM